MSLFSFYNKPEIFVILLYSLLLSQKKIINKIAWRPKKMDSNEYLIVNLLQRHIITAVATQGRRAAREYVIMYALQYSDNGQNWFYYTDENKIIMVKNNKNYTLINRMHI